MIAKGFIGATYKMDALTFDAQRCINMYPMASESGTSKSVGALRSIAGYELAYTLGGGPIRGSILTGSGRAFVQSGADFYEVLAGGAYSLLGTIGTSTNRVSMAENGVEVMIVDGSSGWLFNLTSSVFSEITDANFPVTSSVTFQDGHFIVTEDGTNNFYISAIYDGSAWAALDFSNVVSSSDNLLGCISDTGNIWMFGTMTVEVFTNTGNANFPFERISGAIIQTGCADIQTVQAFDNTIAWLGIDKQGRGVVWKANGYQAQRISTQSIESIISKSTDFTESYAYVYHEQGHVFYVLQVKGLDTTLVYDGSTGLWHERQRHDVATNTTKQHAGCTHFFFNQSNYIGDSVNGSIYRQSLDLYSFAGEAIPRERISPHMNDEKTNVTFSRFELDMETGVGLVAGQGSDPQVMLQYSDDGGRTYGNEIWRSAGKIGEYKARVRWSRLGSARDRVWKVRYTEPTFFQINEAYVNGD